VRVGVGAVPPARARAGHPATRLPTASGVAAAGSGRAVVPQAPGDGDGGSV
jgi:hypothetical protein